MQHVEIPPDKEPDTLIELLKNGLESLTNLSHGQIVFLMFVYAYGVFWNGAHGRGFNPIWNDALARKFRWYIHFKRGVLDLAPQNEPVFERYDIKAREHHFGILSLQDSALAICSSVALIRLDALWILLVIPVLLLFRISWHQIPAAGLQKKITRQFYLSSPGVIFCLAKAL